MTRILKSRTACVPRASAMILAAAALAIPFTLHAQDADKSAPRTIQTFYLHNATTQNDLNDVQTALRNMLPQAKIYGVPHVAAITLSASTADLASAQKLITDLDRPKKTWRLTYTVTEIDGGKSTPLHFSLTVAEGGKSFLKQGSRVPIVTGKYETDKPSSPETQMQYIDIGTNVDVSLEGYEGGLRLKTKFEQSAVDNSSGPHPEDPIIAQTTMETTSAITPGKPSDLGSVAEPNSPHHVQVSVVAEPVK